MESLKGTFLIASRRLLDPNFMRSIVLIVRHDEQGAMGLVLNYPLELTNQELCQNVLQCNADMDGVVYRGGPCQSILMSLHTQQSIAEIDVVPPANGHPGIYLSASQENITWLIREGLDASQRAKFFIGYSGWGPGQLENEIEEGGWVIAPLQWEQVFSTDEAVWSQLMRSATLGQLISDELIPDDPSTN